MGWVKAAEVPEIWFAQCSVVPTLLAMADRVGTAEPAFKRQTKIGAAALNLRVGRLQSEPHRGVVQRLDVPHQRDVLGDRVDVAPGALEGVVQLEAAAADHRHQPFDRLHAELRRIADIEPVLQPRRVVRQLADPAHVVDAGAVDLQERAGGRDLGRGLGDARLHGLLLGDLDAGH